MAGTRDELIFMARLADQAGCYDDMAQYMKQVGASSPVLNVDERNLLSVAFKNAVTARRRAWREVHAMESSDQVSAQCLPGYREKIEGELKGLCTDVTNLLSGTYIPNAPDTESQVFYMKMKADYFRYLAEFTTGAENEAHKQGASASYEEARSVAAALQPAHAIVLGLALNLSVFYYEVCRKPDDAMRTARSAFDQATANMNYGQSAEELMEAQDIMGLLQDNLALWGDNKPGGAEDGTAVEDF